MASHEPEPPTFGLLPCLADYRVHAVHNPADRYPYALCRMNIVPDIYVPGPVMLCQGCLAALADDATLRPAAAERLPDRPDHTGYLTAFWRWWLAGRYDRRIHRAVASERRRG